MQLSERQIMNSFAFKKKLLHGAHVYSTMSETISLEGDHVIVKFNNELEGDGSSQVKENLRRVDSHFSSQYEDVKDI